MRDKTAYLISCSDHFTHRLNVIYDHLRDSGYEVMYITSDFDHVTKQVYQCEVAGHVQLHARPYKRNLSVARIISHRNFARDVFRYLDSLAQEPDLLVVLLPPNFLTYYAAAYKRRHPCVRLVFDIFDMWPEAFPYASVKKLFAPVFRIWAAVRDRNLHMADYITTECDLFREKLLLSDNGSRTIYLCAYPVDCGIYPPDLAQDRVELCYLGSINNIIDISQIRDLLESISAIKPVTLHIIGSGERVKELVDAATAAGADVQFHGALYGDDEKQKIMSRCHFGLNIVKPSVCVGLTMKSVDYFRNGLPIVNNVAADTMALVNNWGAGIQMDENTAEYIAQMTTDEMLAMRKNIRNMFNACFLRSVIDEQYRALLDKIEG